MKINPYHQQKLESSRVGTPGLDKSGDIMVAGQQSDSEQLTAAAVGARNSTYQNVEATNAMNALGLENAMQHHSNLMAQHAKLAAEQQTVNDEHTATAMSGQFALDMIKKRADILGDKSITPDQYPDVFNKVFTETSDTYTTGMNDTQRDHFNKLSQTQQETFMKQAYNDKLEYGTKQAQTAHAQMEHRMVNETDSPDRWALTRFMIADPDVQRNFLRQYESKEAADKAMNGVLHDSAINAIDTNLNEKPQMIEDWLKSGELVDTQGEPLLSGKEINSIKSQILQNKATLVKMAHDNMEMTRNVNEGKAQQALGKAYLHPDNIAASKQYIESEIQKQIDSPNPDKMYLSQLNGMNQTLDAFSRGIDSRAKAEIDAATQGVRNQLSGAEAYAHAAEKEFADMKAKVMHSQQTPEGVAALQAYYTAMKGLNDPNSLRGTYQEIQQLNKAQVAARNASKYLLMPGEENKAFFNSWSAIQAGFERIKDGRVVPSKNSPVPKAEAAGAMKEAEQYARMMSRPASEMLQRALNPTGDEHLKNVINGEFIRQTHDGVKYWEEQLGKNLTGRQITPTEKRGVDAHVEQNMLRTGIPAAKLVAPPVGPSGKEPSAASMKVPAPPEVAPSTDDTKASYIRKLAALYGPSGRDQARKLFDKYKGTLK